MGYQGKALADGDYVMTGFSFENVSGEVKDINLNDVAFVGQQAGWGEFDADIVQVWDGVGFKTFFYYDDTVTTGWFDVGGTEDPIIPAGYAFWYFGYKAEPGTPAIEKSMTVSGQVISRADVKLPVQDGDYMMFVNPYPVATNLNDPDSVVVQNVTPGWGEFDADLIQVWDGTGFKTFFYYDDTVTTGWFDAGGMEEPVIDSGDGFWYFGYIPSGSKEDAQEKKMIFKRPF